MDADDIFHGNGEHAEWVAFVEVFPVREREESEIVDRADVLRLDTGALHFSSIDGNVLIASPHGSLQSAGTGAAISLPAACIRLLYSRSLLHSFPFKRAG